jgi:hypothetical protein
MTQVYFPNEIFSNILSYCNESFEDKKQKHTKSLIKDIDTYRLLREKYKGYKENFDDMIGSEYYQWMIWSIEDNGYTYEDALKEFNDEVSFKIGVVQSEYHKLTKDLFVKYKFINRKYIKMTEQEIEEFWTDIM